MMITMRLEVRPCTERFTSTLTIMFLGMVSGPADAILISIGTRETLHPPFVWPSAVSAHLSNPQV